jgi:CRP-like cAMP-binding protein
MNPLSLFRNEPNAMVLDEGASLFRSGDPGDAMYVVLEGSIDVVHRSRVIESVGAGGIVGELALIDDEPRSADAIARTPATLAVVSRERFTFLAQQTPFFALHVMRVLADRLRRTTDRL